MRSPRYEVHHFETNPTWEHLLVILEGSQQSYPPLTAQQLDFVEYLERIVAIKIDHAFMFGDSSAIPTAQQKRWAKYYRQ